MSTLPVSGSTSTTHACAPNGNPGVTILPGSQSLEYECDRDPADDARQHVLRDFVREVRDAYDMILVDCPPNTLLGSWSALVAGDGVIVPIQVEDFGAQGLKQLAGTLNRVRKLANPGLALLGYLITMYQKRLALHQTYGETLLRRLQGRRLPGRGPVPE